MTEISLAGPPVDAQIKDGDALSVTGIAWSRDLAPGEPNPIDDVTVEVDGTQLAVTRIPVHRVEGQSTVGFSASFVANINRRYHIVATAVDDRGRSAVARRQVTTGTSGPLNATLSGTATFVTNFSMSGMTIPPSTSPETALLIFNGPRTTISPFLDDIAIPPATTTSGMVTVITSGTVKISSSGLGTFTQSTGRIGLPISLLFEIRVVVNLGSLTLTDRTEASTLPVTLTTGTSLSPSGAFSLTGSPLASSGAVTLVGTGSFSGGWLNGFDGAITYTGVISPVP